MQTLILLALAIGVGVYLGRKTKDDGPSILDPGPIPKTLEAESSVIDDRKFQEETTDAQRRDLDKKVQLDVAEAENHARGVSTTRVGNNVIPSEQPLTKEQYAQRYREWIARNMGKKEP